MAEWLNRLQPRLDPFTWFQGSPQQREPGFVYRPQDFGGLTPEHVQADLDLALYIAQYAGRTSGTIGPRRPDSVQGSQALQPVQPSWNMSPSERADVNIHNERVRTEHAKYDFTPEEIQKQNEWNAKARAHNAKYEPKIAALESQIAQIENDPGLSEKKKNKLLKKLNKKLGKLKDKLEPPLDLATITREVDQIMNDPSKSEKQKKKEVDRIRKKYGLPKRGSTSMKSLVTGRLGKIYGESKERMESISKQHKAELKAQLRHIEKTYGKNSPQAKAAKAELKAVDQKYDEEVDRLKGLEKQLKKMYKKRGFFSFLGDIFKAIGKALDFVMPFIKMIPGIGQIAGLVYGGIKAVTSAISGNWQNFVSSLVSIVPVIGDAIGAAGSAIMETAGKVLNYAKSGMNFVGNVVTGNWSGAVASLGGLAGAAELDGLAPAVTGEIADVAGHAAVAVQSGEAFARGDIAGGFAGISGFAGGLKGQGVLPDVTDKVADAAGYAVQGIRTVQQFESGNLVGGLSGVSGLATDLNGRGVLLDVTDKVADVAGYAAHGVHTVQQFEHGNVSGGIAGVANLSGRMGADGIASQVMADIQRNAEEAGRIYAQAEAVHGQVQAAIQNPWGVISQLPIPFPEAGPAWRTPPFIPVPQDFQALQAAYVQPPLFQTLGQDLAQRLYAQFYS